MTLTKHQAQLLKDAQQYYAGHRGSVGVLLTESGSPMFIKSGEDGGPWGGAHRGGVPRALTRAKIGVPGYGFTGGAPHEGNIATHVEGHAAAIMWQRDLRRAELIVDRAMCGICSASLYNALPAGTEMRVFSEDEGETIVRSSHG